MRWVKKGEWVKWVNWGERGRGGRGSGCSSQNRHSPPVRLEGEGEGRGGGGVENQDKNGSCA